MTFYLRYKAMFNFIKELSSQATFQDEKNEAWDSFQKTVTDISKISKTDWYKAIVDYWTREVDACEKRLLTMTSDNFKPTQAELNLAKRFLEYLEMLRNPPL